MTLDQKITDKILNFVKIRPRTVQEISEHIKKNWRTAERYVDIIKKETGQISWKVFREGTRGALKIVYWSLIEDFHSTHFQEELLDDVLHGKWYFDFSPFNIYQHVDAKKKDVLVDTSSDPELKISKSQDLVSYLRKAKKQILIFSGNLSWTNGKQDGIAILDILRELAERGVSIKIIARISLIGAENSEHLLAINKTIGKDIIDIRNRYQPLRAIIIDDRVVRFREIKSPEYYKDDELKKKIGFFYDIYDKEWIRWIQKVFWKMFSLSIPAEKRIKEIEEVQKNVPLKYRQ